MGLGRPHRLDVYMPSCINSGEPLMRSIFKFAMVGAALVASSAYADVLLPSSGNGELTLFVKNNTTGAVYARGLQITVDNVLTQAAIQSGAFTGPVQSTNYA